MHFDDPAVPAYVLAGHDVHTDPAAEEYVPFAHGAHDDAPADDDVPIGHFVHSLAPAVSVYVPGKHIMHTDPALQAPFLQLICVCVHDDAPADDDDPIGQTVHVDDPVVSE